MDSRHFFFIISVIALGAAVFSPLLPATYLTLRFVLPEIFWVSNRVLIFVSALYAGVGVLVVAGVPAALFERIAGRPRDDDITMLVWAASTAIVAVCAWQFLG